MLTTSENERSRESQRLQMLAAQRVVGALVTPSGGGTPSTEQEAGVPLVLIDYESPEHPCSVVVDHVDGGRQAARHLIGLGHTDLAFVGGLPDLRQFEQRIAGIREEMAAAGLDPTALRVLRSEGIGVASGEHSADELLASGPTAQGSSAATTCSRSACTDGSRGPGSGFPKTLRWSATTTSTSRPTGSSR
ncbi:LacI family transcriptional regulator [Tessaracoccus sp. HDW20]|nr:LacI family transcriptional regulator [Tessaracoccus coleopterorum]